ncbi:hypothetical protein AAZX31_15G193700 [Glycine max]|uniref:Tetraspanin-11 n=1 Tax=Glycine max TaxID=3847 RepID=I1MI24_SOYBN|nr:tetraspanin-11 [Glycine max]KAG4946970.1 hypothetical protein JHK87_042977 [Glycine soja]KAG5106061.1 hypothetical protein JHK82_043031 [Glycine max]KRH12951.1 hypothetical protein GLYMA_15G207300v4 [Glycine max]|eukprot:XP_003547633.1 tetraspanin-11 [Glycine max]
MFRINNTLVGILHTLPLLLSIAAMGDSAYIRVHGDCQKVLQYPLLFGGLFIFVISTLGLVGVLCRVNAALYLYLLATFFVILAFSPFTIVALFVTRNNAPDRAGPSVGYGVGDFSPWLQHYVTDQRNWDVAQSCLVQKRVCHGLAVDANNNDSLAFKRLTTTQIGCCKPPLRCGFTKKNATFWEAPKAGPLANDTDCRTWSNRQDKLCFNCDSCKGGVLANIRSQWRHLTIFNACVLVLVTIIYVLGCYAIRNNRLEYSNYTTQRKIRMRIPSTVI